MSDYHRFLAQKHLTVAPSGFDVHPNEVNSKLFHYQRDLVRWALHLGKAALFAGVGLGKTAMYLEWARLVAKHTGKPVLVLEPLAVAAQTVEEGEKFGIEAVYVEDDGQMLHHLTEGCRIFITNYDRIHLFDVKAFGGVVLDESSILKHYSKTFFDLVQRFEETPFKLCATATPAPNDWVEFGNHAMFLGIMHFKDMLARWFVGEGDIARKARLKRHAEGDFWRWLTSWAVCMKKPSDLGPEYDMPGFILPEMHVYEHRLGVSDTAIDRAWKQGRLIVDDAPSATEFMKVKRESLPLRVAQVQEIVASIDDTEPIILWVDTDFEADALLAVFPDALEVRGSQPTKRKEESLKAFSQGKARLIITKPEIAGMGLNWQHACHMVFAGLSFSFERWYQALGRIHRYGQTRECHVHFVYAETEGNVVKTLKDKQAAFDIMQAEMSAAIRSWGLFRDGEVTTVYSASGSREASGEGWRFALGDCIEFMPTLEEGSVHLTVTSIPFSNLYIYSDSEADVGNAADKDEFFQHMAFVIRELYRVTMPGRCCAVHVKDLPLFQNRDGCMGIDPFSDDTVAAFRREGWVLQSRVTIEKDPVIEMQKTNSHGLLFKNWKERSEILRTGLPDYMLIFVKPGECPEPIRHDPTDTTYFGDNPPADWRYPKLPSRKNGDMNTALPIWQEYANPNWSDVTVPLVWADINQTNVLNYLVAKGDRDERHICPLQLDVISRCIQWKSNPGDVIFDPFGGIGSTPYRAIQMGRCGLGVELKEDYWKLAIKYLKVAEVDAAQPMMF